MYKKERGGRCIDDAFVLLINQVMWVTWWSTQQKRGGGEEEYDRSSAFRMFSVRIFLP